MNKKLVDQKTNADNESNKASREELTKKILFVAGFGLTMSAIFLMPNFVIAVGAIMKTFKDQDKSQPQLWKVKRLFKNWEKRKLLTLEEKDGELIATFTDNGKKLLLKAKFDEMEITKPKKWDEKWHLVIFDIPEKKRSSRGFLRNKLKELGFLQLQKSVFVFPYDCEKEIEIIARVYEIEQYVSYARVEYMSAWDEEKARNYFNLN